MSTVAVVVRLFCFMALALLFIVQQVFAPLVTIWVSLGEYFHCASFVLLVDMLLHNKGFKGLSIKTQILYLFVYWFRYIDSFFITHPNHWILALKLFYMAFSVALVVSIIFLRSTWERSKDTCSVLILGLLSLLLGGLNFALDGQSPAAIDERFLNFFRIVSHYLQGFAMLPQFIFCYRDTGNRDKVLVSYILLLGAYRLFYAINWIERAYKERFFYVSGPMGLGILIIFLSDFIMYKIKDRSCISDFVLKLDDSVSVSQQPLLRAVYGESYERLPPPIDVATPSARIPPIELSLRNVQVVGRPSTDLGLPAMVDPYPSTALPGSDSEDETPRDATAHTPTFEKNKGVSSRDVCMQEIA